MKRSLGLIGARGYVGRELVALVDKHGELELALAMSQRDGMTPSDVAATKLDAYVLALPNGASEMYVAAISEARPDAVIVDLSADHRFNPAWIYGQPERLRASLSGATRIANPGCYATAAQLALSPIAKLLQGPANVFGVSGYSGAGTTPSPKNDPVALADNLMPYSLVGHGHEREIEFQIGHRVFFMPHVAAFFRGLSVTVSVQLAEPRSRAQLQHCYDEAFGREPMVRLVEDAPLVRDVRERHHVAIGGLSVSDDGMHAVVVATLDNLLAGAATQALRNLNLALGYTENQGVLS